LNPRPIGLVLAALTLFSCVAALAQKNIRDVDNSILRFKGITGWTGTFSYKLDLDRDESYGDFSFLASSGQLASQERKKINIEGKVSFSGGSGGKFTGQGNASYRVESFSLGTWGNKSILFTTDGRGDSDIIPEQEINHLRFELREGAYSLSISPGDYCEETNEFGVEVFVSDRLELTDSLLEDLKNAGREVPLTQILRAMFPDRFSGSGCMDIGVNVGLFPLPAFGNILSGSMTDHYGGILSWELLPMDPPIQEFLVPVEITEASNSSIHVHPPDNEDFPRIRALTIEAELAERRDDPAPPGIAVSREVLLFLAREQAAASCGRVESVAYTLESAGANSAGNTMMSWAIAHMLEQEGGTPQDVEDESVLARTLVSLQTYNPEQRGLSHLTNELYGMYIVGEIKLDQGIATIRLREDPGSLERCRAERITGQLEETAKQFAFVNDVRLMFDPGRSPERQP